jgi:hypothetical protein
MIYTVRCDTGKLKKGIKVYNDLDEIDFEKTPTLSEKIQVGKKYYSVTGVINGEDGDRLVDVVEVDKSFQSDIDQVYRHDRMRHRVFTTKDGEETRDKSGKVIRKWDKEGNLVKGEPYPEIKKASI